MVKWSLVVSITCQLDGDSAACLRLQSLVFFPVFPHFQSFALSLKGPLSLSAFALARDMYGRQLLQLVCWVAGLNVKFRLAPSKRLLSKS